MSTSLEGRECAEISVGAIVLHNRGFQDSEGLVTPRLTMGETGMF